MNVIPPDTDELLWEVARDPHSATAEQFRARYPELVAELDKRAEMLRGLRHARRGPGDEIPEPRVLAGRNPMISMPRWSVGVAATLLLFSIGLAFMAVFNRPQAAAEDAAVATSLEVQPSESRAVTDADQSEKNVENRDRPQMQGINEENRGSIGSPVPFARPPFERSVTIQEQSVSLTNAIQAITAQAGISVTVAPGFEDKAVTVQFKDVPALVALRTLGSQNGFRVVEQGNAEVLIIPENSSTTPLLVDPQREQSNGPPTRSSTGGLPSLPPAGN
ncbi:MAG: hypothetical protein KF812_11585 [Fimbriimonadaceae bacterium]|nr:hypothetical protein [Fimbriimonadaceae bacterium]